MNDLRRGSEAKKKKKKKKNLKDPVHDFLSFSFWYEFLSGVGGGGGQEGRGVEDHCVFLFHSLSVSFKLHGQG